ncbi:hypothetical protein MKEN_00189800 [Mycena kentingensis (nom. inval.)]|nr:hypothetical protein MKEN_00189800 [Mycena kentingensis (nom. inval.)]
MAPRIDFAPFRTHYFCSVTLVLATLAWFLSLIFQGIATAQFGHRTVGVLWFAILLQGILNFSVILALATDSVANARLQISIFGAVAMVFSVFGVDAGLFAPLKSQSSLQAMGTGYLISAFVDILWVLFFTSEEDSVLGWVFSRMTRGGDGGGLTWGSGSTIRGSRRRRAPALGSGNVSVSVGVSSGSRSSFDKDAKYGLGLHGTPIAVAMTMSSDPNGEEKQRTPTYPSPIARNANPDRAFSSPSTPAANANPRRNSLPSNTPHPNKLKRSTTGGRSIRSVSSRKSIASSLRMNDDLPPAPGSPPYIPPMPLLSLGLSTAPQSFDRERESSMFRPARVSSGIDIPVPSARPQLPTPPPPTAHEYQHQRWPDGSASTAARPSSSETITVTYTAPSPATARERENASLPAAGGGGGGDGDTIPLPKARALHAYNGSSDDPEELSFKKGEILEIEDQQGKWWQARKADGSFGIVPSNYLVLL